MKPKDSSKKKQKQNKRKGLASVEGDSLELDND